MTTRQQRTWIGLMSLIGVAGLSALIGAVIAGNTLDHYVETVERVAREGTELTAVRPQAVPGTMQEALATVRQRTEGSVVPLVTLSDQAHAQGVVRSRAVAAAIPLTTDGWILVPDAAVRAWGTTLRLVASQQNIFSLEGGQLDAATGYRFVKTEVQNARVASFGASERVNNGTTVYVVFDGQVVPRTIQDAMAYPSETAWQTSEQLDRHFLLDQPVALPVGALVTDSSGALLGVLETETLVRPIHQLTPALESVLTRGSVVRPLLGVRVRDVNRVVTEETVREGVRVLAVSRPAAREAGLRVGDVILRVQGVSVADMPFAEAIQQQAVGTTVQLTIEREGTTQEISVTL